ncbi:MAG: sigma-70 family RNA polymerase sigma factor [Planctomycetota bacterium]
MDNQIPTDANVNRFVRLLSKNERHLRAFVFNLLVDCDAVDEVMQETYSVLWRKFDELEDESGFLKWAYVTARYEVLMYRRRCARSRLVFDEDLIQTLSIESMETGSTAEADRRRSQLARCLQKLTESERRLLLSAYSQRTKINQLAATLNRSANSLYKSLGRLRRRLKACIDSHPKEFPV